MKRLSRRYRANIDLGSSKVCCWIGHESLEEPLSIIGSGHVECNGLWQGHFTDISALEQSITQVLYEAEQQAHVQVRQAIVTLGGSFFISELCTAETALSGESVNSYDMRALVLPLKRPNYHPVHIIPLEFSLDHQEKIKDPRGMIGKTLKGLFHVLWMANGSYHTLLASLKRCQVHLSDLVFSGYTSALSCVSLDEQDLGMTLIDIGASCTTLSFFFQGRMVESMTIPLGGYHMTQDIARGWNTPLAYAERLKILHGAALTTLHDQHEMVEVIPMGEGENVQNLSRAFLIHILQARCEEIIDHIKQRLKGARFPSSIQRLVLTGGASQLLGFKELVQRLLGRPVRMARPLHLPQAPGSTPDFSSLIGAFLYEGMPLTSLLLPSKKERFFFSWFKKKL